MLKKIAAVTAIVAALGSNALGFVGTTYTDITADALKSVGFAFKPSNNVGIMIIDDGNATAPQAYTLGSKHVSGDRIISTSSGSTGVYYYSDQTDALSKPGKTIAQASGKLPTTAGESLYSSGWTAL